MKTLIVSPCTLPVPAVHGGAVQQLIDSIIQENEKLNMLDLHVAGLWDDDAVNASKEIKNTSFIYWREPLICKVIDGAYEWFYTKVLRKNHRTLKLHARKLFVIRQIAKELLKHDYDRVVFENMGYQLKAIRNKKVAEKYKGRLWFHIHNDVPNNVDRKCLKKVKLMMISKYLGNKVVAMCGHNSPEMHVVKNGIDVKRFCKVPADAVKKDFRTRFGIRETEKVILFVGRIIPEKGVEQVIDSFLQIMSNNQNVVLLIVGSLNFDLERTSEFEKTIHQKSKMANGRIKFTGFIPQSEISALYHIADVAVLPSMWEEPAGLTMLEAAAAGVPVITTNAGGIPEYLRNDLGIFLDRDNELVNNISNNIVAVLNNPDKWEKISEEAKKYVSATFSEEKFYESFVDTIQGVNI